MLTIVKKEFTKVIPTKTITLEKQLRGIKTELEEIRNRRRELMFRLRSANFTFQQIGEIYGCSKQYVDKEISEYVEQFKQEN